jgi:RNA polymerase sigma-70 factor (ECF subfamily)
MEKVFSFWPLFATIDGSMNKLQRRPGDPAFDQHLSQISTAWTMLFAAHAGGTRTVGAAQGQLLQRYSAAVYRYLVAAVRDSDIADELFQEFALRFVRGDFKRADRERGRFRDFLKTALYHLIVDHQRKQQRRHLSLTPDAPEPTAKRDSDSEVDQDFMAIWRAELLDRAWEGLAEIERQTGQPLHTVLRWRTDHPEMRSPQMAEQLAARVGKAVTAEWVRKRLFVARERFTDLLLEEVARSLESPTAEMLEQELLDLGLFEYCRAGLDRRRKG